MKSRIRVLTRKTEIQAGLCLLIENGVPCPKPAKTRGLCSGHYGWIRTHKRLHEFALPLKSLKKDLRPNESPVEGVCRVVDSGIACTEPAARRGLCDRHYASIWQRSDLEIDDFAAPKGSLQYKRQNNPVPGYCIIRERKLGGVWVHCDRPHHGRGLCALHHHRLRKSPIFERIALPRRTSTFRLRPKLVKGICVVVQDHVGCTRPAKGARRVCKQHYASLHSAGKLEELTDRFLNPTYVIQLKSDESFVEGFCRVTVNGVPCTHSPKRRGLCGPCIHLIERSETYTFELFAAPLRKHRYPDVARNPRYVQGVCLAVVDGIPCQRSTSARGLCKEHYKLVTRMKRFDEFALTAVEAAALPETPHFYLDKNIVIRFAMHEIFTVTPDQYSVRIVQAVLDRRLRATVSLDCIRALYSHVGHRLARSPEEGGKGLDETAAEHQARSYAGELFFARDGLWHFLPFTQEQFDLCSCRGRLPELSLEDALEVHLYAIAKRDHGAQLFVTADGGILRYSEATHPRKVCETWKEMM